MREATAAVSHQPQEIKSGTNRQPKVTVAADRNAAPTSGVCSLDNALELELSFNLVLIVEVRNKALW
jgi:hypothetical protein